MIRLRVWANVRPMGWFGHAAGEYFFAYDLQWLGQPGAYVLAPQFPLVGDRFTGALVRSFFENLLPEGRALEDVVNALALRDPSTFEPIFLSYPSPQALSPGFGLGAQANICSTM